MIPTSRLLILALATASIPVLAQTGAQATAPGAAALQGFDVASIRANNTASDGHHHIYNDPAESHFRTVNLSIKDLIQEAHDQISSAQP